MAFTVTFYNFDKVKNSTARPSGGNSFDCTLKDQSTVLSPIIKLQIGVNAPVTSNYAYIPNFNRYYFVKDWVNDGLLWIAHLTVDVLASFKTEIGASTQYILRSSAEYDDNIMDNAYPTAGGYYTTTVISPEPGAATDYKAWHAWEKEFENGMYVVGVVNDNQQGKVGGALTYYCMAHLAFKRMMELILQNVDWAGVDPSEISDNLLKVLIEPMQYIKSLMWFPISMDNLDTDGWPFFSKMDFGFWETPTFAGGRILDKSTYRLVADMPLPKHPQAESDFSYYNLQPFTKYTLKFPPYPDMILDGLQTYALKNVQLRINIDFVTGQSKLNIVRLSGGVSSDIILDSVNAIIGIPLDVGDVVRDYAGAATGILGSLASLVTGNPFGILTGVTSTAESSAGKPVYQGAPGSIAGLYDSPVLVMECLEQVSVNYRTNGRPLYKRRQVSTLGGYMTCQNPRIKINGFDSELDAVTSYMSQGFYYE